MTSGDMVLFTSKGMTKFLNKLRGIEEELEKKYIDLGETMNQSSETFHDNGPAEAIEYEMRVLRSRITEMRRFASDSFIEEYPRTIPDKKVDYGTGVRFLRDGQLKDIKIVCYSDADPDNGRVSYESPLAQALVGHAQGEEYTAQITKGLSKIVIREVYPLNEEEFS